MKNIRDFYYLFFAACKAKNYGSYSKKTKFVKNPNKDSRVNNKSGLLLPDQKIY